MNEVQKLRIQRELKEMRSLVSDLDNEDWQIRLKAVGKLPKQRRTTEMVSESVPALIVATSDKNPYVAKAAIPALGDIGPQAAPAISRLTDLLADEDQQVRRSAAYSLGKIGAAAIGSAQPLIELLRDTDPEVRKAVAWALGIIGPETVPLLRAAVADENKDVRSGCVFALGNIGPNAIDALPELISCLEDIDTDVRYNAAKAVGNLRAAKESELAVPQLIIMLDDSDPDVRWVAAEALRKIGTDEATKAWLHYESQPISGDLVKQLFNDDKSIRIDAAEGLVKIISERDEALVPKIKPALKDQLWKVRKPVCEALAKLGPSAKDAVKSLKRSLKDENDLVRAAAAHALGRIGPEAEIAVVRLIKRLKDESKDVRTASGIALELIGTEEAVEALEKFNWE